MKTIETENEEERISIMMIENNWSEEEALKWMKIAKEDVNLHDFLSGTEFEIEWRKNSESDI